MQRFEHTGRVVRFGFGVGCEYRAINVRYDMNGTTFELEAKGRSFLVRLPLIGDFNVYNALGALAAAQGVSLNLREAIRACKTRRRCRDAWSGCPKFTLPGLR